MIGIASDLQPSPHGLQPLKIVDFSTMMVAWCSGKMFLWRPSSTRIANHGNSRRGA
jgi:hypothetical protein